MNASLLLMTVLVAADPKEIPLYTGPVPLAAEGDKAAPTLTIYPVDPEKATGAAVVVCPGGGYSGLAMDHEGKQVAEWMNARGVAAFVLKYRTASIKKTPLLEAPMFDVQRAIRHVRANAGDYKIDAKKIGVMGFSAGGHLASTAATHFDNGKADATDATDKASCRPDFAILCYPVISMKTGTTHGGSRQNLIGAKPDDKLVDFFSNELQVTEATPPTFLFHTDEDKAVLPENSLLFYMALKKAKVPAEMHLYEKGHHGVGLANDPKWEKGVPNIRTWPERLEGWLKLRGYVK
jgi:acetyl esterase/lipase